MLLLGIFVYFMLALRFLRVHDPSGTFGHLLPVLKLEGKDVRITLPAIKGVGRLNLLVGAVLRRVLRDGDLGREAVVI